MRIILLLAIFSITVHSIVAQPQYSDSLKKAFLAAKEDTSKVAVLGLLSVYYSGLYPDSGMYYADKMIELSGKNNYKYGKALGMFCKGFSVLKKGDFTSSIQLGFKSLNLAEELEEKRMQMMWRSYSLIGQTYAVSGNIKEALFYLNNAIDQQKKSGEDAGDFYSVYYSMAFTMMIQDKTDSALIFLKKGSDLFSKAKEQRDVQPYIVSANVYRSSGDLKKAEYFYRSGVELGKACNSFFYVAAISNDLGSYFYEKGMKDSALLYMRQCLFLSQKYHYQVFEMFSSRFLYDFYDKINADSTLKYMKIYNAVREENFTEEKLKQFQAAKFEQEGKEKDLKNAQAKYEDRLKMYSVIGAAVTFLVIAFFLFRNNRQKEKANNLLEHQKQKVESTLTELKAAQSQLIQSEKMASLGELTAGIAHEIQNPLNFVNNFSDVNRELLIEMKGELDKGNVDEVKAIANDVIDNEEKINHHGKRADAIVKGMLQHSRSSTAQKELTDINALCNEYLRLAYHGLRAKDKDFNATLNTNFDPTLQKINIIPQDIGRVLLNLFNNAFYAVNEKKKHAGEDYEPTVTVSTRLINERSLSPSERSGRAGFGEGRGEVEIKVSDNGGGMDPAIIDKIFQPFFTTKPTGQGTGLGLSLSYDIIKAHGGEIKVETKEARPDDPVGRGVGTTFIIQLPFNTDQR